jgi:hypothetical protein
MQILADASAFSVQQPWTCLEPQNLWSKPGRQAEITGAIHKALPTIPNSSHDRYFGAADHQSTEDPYGV